MILRSTTATTVRTACPTCGLVDVMIDEVTVLVTSRGASAGYAYDCPACTDHVEVQAGSRVLGMLYDIGARVALSNLTDVSLHREEQIRKFQLLLDGTDDIAGAIEQSR